MHLLAVDSTPMSPKLQEFMSRKGSFRSRTSDLSCKRDTAVFCRMNDNMKAPPGFILFLGIKSAHLDCFWSSQKTPRSRDLRRAQDLIRTQHQRRCKSLQCLCIPITSGFHHLKPPSALNKSRRVHLFPEIGSLDRCNGKPIERCFGHLYLPMHQS